MMELEKIITNILMQDDRIKEMIKNSIKEVKVKNITKTVEDMINDVLIEHLGDYMNDLVAGAIEDIWDDFIKNLASQLRDHFGLPTKKGKKK